MERLAADLKGGGVDDKVVLQVSVGADDATDDRRYLTASPGRAGGDRVSRPDVEVVIAPETFWKMAEGAYSPVAALQDGRLRLRGDMTLAKRLLRFLAGPGGSVDCG
ncbi:SCP2 sterol-binding domain-containing protein [Spirillospora sp. NPDC047279]|uniref:SCP2 sterol-binding domain-containing protein n=1 Tax=Spirillospora sp. NPDC047279 TaxID=3155478 RepID=UPI003400FE7D